MRRSIPALLLLLAVLVLTAAACGGDDEAADTTEAAAPTADIVDTAVDAGSFSTLAELLGAADLVDTLKGDGPYTVFAPTDEAFAALPQATLDELRQTENVEQLQAILLYHVAEGDVRAADLSDGQEITTVQGEPVTVTLDGDMVTVNGATVTSADVVASNGVIHVLDAVLLPPS